MSEFEVTDAFHAVLDRLDSAHNERFEMRHDRDKLSREVDRLESDLRHVNFVIKELRAENDLLRRRPAEAAPTAPLTPPYDAISKDETPRARGQKARIEGLGHKVPPDLRNDPAGAQEFVEGWASQQHPFLNRGSPP